MIVERMADDDPEETDSTLTRPYAPEGPTQYEGLPRERPLVGERIAGRYRLAEALGEDALGARFIAKDETLGTTVRLELLSVGLDEERARQLRGEARALASIEHPGVPRVLDLVVDAAACLVVELVRGETLAERLAGGALPAAVAVELTTRLCWALHAAHQAGVVHGALGPDEIVLQRDFDGGDVLRLCEIGRARLAAAAGLVPPPTVTHYLAPEQLDGREVDARADVYAVGCLLYHMLAGQPPFADAADAADLGARHLGQPPAALAARVPDVTRGLDKTVRRALAKNAADRFPSMRSFVEALSASRAERHARRHAHPRPRRLLIAVALGAAALGAVAALTATRARRSVPREAPGLLLIDSQPPGATVRLDGAALAETTPTAVRGLGAGTHALLFSRPGRQEVRRRIELHAGERTSMMVALPLVSRRLEVHSVPPGADVFLDGVLGLGVSPTTVQLSDGEFHRVRVERSGYKSASADLKPDDRRASIELTLEPETLPVGALIVEANGAAEVWIDGAPTGMVTPTVPLRLAAGEHQIELRNGAGGRTAPTRVTLQRGQTVRIALGLPAESHR
jgi:hypothetical protein